MKKNELKALIKEAFLTEKKNTLLNESAPGFDNRKQGEPLPTLESIKAAYQAKKLEEKAEDTKEETEATKELTAAVKDLGDAKEEAGLKEDRFVDAALEDLRQVIDNLAHTSGMDKGEAAEMAMMHIEDMFLAERIEEEVEDDEDLSPEELANKHADSPMHQAPGMEESTDIKKEGVEKDYYADYTDIGMFYLDGLGMESTLTDDQFEKLGEKIVKQLYGGDVGKAYDDIVRGKKRGSHTDVSEVKMDKEFKAVAAGARKSEELNKIANRLYPEIAKKQEGGKLVNFYPLNDDQIRAVYAEYTKLNEVEIAEATELPKDIEWEFDDVIDQIDIHNATIALIGHSESTGKDYTASAEASKIGDEWDWIEVDEVEEEPINESVITEADMIVESFKK